MCQVSHGEHFSMWHGVCLPLAKILRISRKKEIDFFSKKSQKSENKAKVLERIVDTYNIGHEQKEL